MKMNEDEIDGHSKKNEKCAKTNKNREKNVKGNCRSKSLLSILGNILEKLVYDSLSPKAVSKILSDTTDGENFGTNGRNY